MVASFFIRLDYEGKQEIPVPANSLPFTPIDRAVCTVALFTLSILHFLIVVPKLRHNNLMLISVTQKYGYKIKYQSTSIQDKEMSIVLQTKERYASNWLEACWSNFINASIDGPQKG